MSNIRGPSDQPYGQVTGKSRVVKNHAYGQDDAGAMMRISSHVTTENQPSQLSHPVLHPVSEYTDDKEKQTMFDPLPVDLKLQTHGIAQSSSKDIGPPDHATTSVERSNSPDRQEQQESDR